MIFQELSDRDARKIVCSRMESANYWMIPLVSVPAILLSNEIEMRFYAEERNRDFEVYAISVPHILLLTFAHKRHMPEAELRKIFSEFQLYEIDRGDVSALSRIPNQIWLLPPELAHASNRILRMLAEWISGAHLGNLN